MDFMDTFDMYAEDAMFPDLDLDLDNVEYEYELDAADLYDGE